MDYVAVNIIYIYIYIYTYVCVHVYVYMHLSMSSLSIDLSIYHECVSQYCGGKPPINSQVVLVRMR